MGQLIDTFGREHRSLRVSVTDRCNLRCHYCMPVAGIGCVPREELLTFEEITFACQVAAGLGIKRVRLTGGEPLLRAHVSKLVRMLRDETDIEDIALTTNALLLARHAAALAEAGLDRLNVSIDSLDEDRFAHITRFGKLEPVWNAIRIAADAGISPIKINSIALAGFNDDEFDRWLQLTVDRGVIIRFMELMPMGEGAKLGPDVGSFLDLTQTRRQLVEKWGLEPAESRGNGPAKYWRVPGAQGMIGFITPMSDPYCDTCSRLRLTSKGQIRACLADEAEYDVSAAIRSRDEESVARGFLDAVAGKPRGHMWSTGAATPTGMSQLGG